jgi:hypothetical protein
MEKKSEEKEKAERHFKNGKSKSKTCKTNENNIKNNGREVTICEKHSTRVGTNVIGRSESIIFGPKFSFQMFLNVFKCFQMFSNVRP